MSRVIQRAEIAARLIRGLHLKERSPAPTLAPEIVGVVVIDDFSKPDGFQPDPPVGYVPCWARSRQGASIGNFSKVRLINPLLPVGSVIMVMEGVYVGTIGDFFIAVMPSVGGTVTGHVRDTRVPGAIVGNTAKGLTEINASAVSDFPIGLESQSAAGVTLPFTDLDGVVVTPGNMLSVSTENLNTQLTVAFLWREYAQAIK